VDLRKGYNGLFGLVKSGLKKDPLSGELYLFVNRRRKGCKVLVWDGTGLCIFQKRLERGRFADLWRQDGRSASLTTSELALFIEGCELVGRRALSPAVVVPETLAASARL
jgi:transposase